MAIILPLLFLQIYQNHYHYTMQYRQHHQNRQPCSKNKTVTQDILQSLRSLSKTISPEGAMTVFSFLPTDDQRRKAGDLILQAWNPS